MVAATVPFLVSGRGILVKITAIRAQKSRERANIYLDGEYAFSLHKMLAARLAVGQELAEQDIQQLRAQDLVEQAYERALRYLAYRPRSEQEIRRYLQKRAVSPQAVEQVVARLRRVHLIDDAAFAAFWVENREAFRPRGAWVLRAELRQKGVAPDAIEEALGQHDEEQSAFVAGERAARRYRMLDREAFYRRMLGYLQRRGFAYGIARRVTDYYWAYIEKGKQEDTSGSNGHCPMK